MEQLSKQTIDALRVELARYGLDVKASRKPKAAKADPSEIDARIARLRAMTFKTAGVKSAMLATLQRVKREGYANDRFPSLVNPYRERAERAYIDSNRLLYRQRLLPSPR